ncbi:Fibroblast growth factor receptor 3-like protein, partial [Dinothrombium tinctorium]
MRSPFKLLILLPSIMSVWPQSDVSAFATGGSEFNKPNRSTKSFRRHVPNQKPQLKEDLSVREFTLPVGQRLKLRCPVNGDPKPKLKWFKNGKNVSEQDEHIKIGKQNLKIAPLSEQDTGNYTCFANNSYGELSVNFSVNVVPLVTSTSTRLPPDYIHMTELNRTSIKQYKPYFTAPEKMQTYLYVMRVGQAVTFVCQAAGEPSPKYTWLKDDGQFYRANGNEFELKSNGDLYLENLSPSDEGNYTCVAANEHGTIEVSYRLELEDFLAHKPIFEDGKPANQTVTVGDTAIFECRFRSDVSAEFAWFRVLTINESFNKIEPLQGNERDKHVLLLPNVTHEDEGWYGCLAKNQYGYETKKVYLNVTEGPEVVHIPHINYKILWVALPLLLLIVLIFVYLLAKEKKQKITVINAQQSFIIKKKIVLQHDCDKSNPFSPPLVKIDCESMTTDVSMSDIGHLVTEYEFPLDPDWEFPRDKLVFGKQLGAGAFGVVRKAEAFNLHGRDGPTVVAVKMCKDGHTDAEIKDLVSEMEVMKKIGKHINIINLLGCCTQNGPLFVIVEYAPHGNLRDFLRTYRPSSGYEVAIGEMKSNTLSFKDLVSFAYQ